MSNITIKEFDKVKDRFLKHAPLEVFEKEAAFAIQIIKNSSGLQKCTIESNLKAVYNISLTGLTLNPVAKQAYLIPRYNGFTKQMETVLEPSYMGLIKLLTDAGSVKSMVSAPVYENDHFIINLADNIAPVIHNPYLKRERGEIIGFYSVASLHDGTRQAEWMPVEDINEIRDRSESYKAFKAGKIKSCVWESDYSEMGRKTVIKRHYKTLPRTNQMSKIDEAINITNEDYRPSDSYISFLTNKVLQSGLSEDEKADLEMELSVCNSERAKEIQELIELNQVDPISSGRNYSQRDILEKLDTLT